MDEALEKGLRWLVTGQINKERETMARIIKSIEKYLMEDTHSDKERAEAEENLVLVNKTRIDLAVLRDAMWEDEEVTNGDGSSCS